MKKDFPIFAAQPNQIYLDNAATTHKPKQVIEALRNFYAKSNATIHRGIYPDSVAATQLYEGVREEFAAFIGAKANEVFFTKGATEGLNALSYMLAPFVEKDSTIVLSEMEHHSNILPWQILAEFTGAKLAFIPITKSYELDMIGAKKLITKKTAIVAITHLSNVLGTVNDVKTLSQMAKKAGAISIIDGTQSVSKLPVDVKKIGCDFFVCSGHKMYGPTGVGVVYGRENLLNELEPYQVGGDMVESVSKKDAKWLESPQRFEAGTQSVADVIGLGAAVYYLSGKMKNVQKHDKELVNYAKKRLKELGVNVYSPKNAQGCVAFSIAGIHSHDIADELGQKNICVRGGHHCCMPLHKKLGIVATTRISFGVYNTEKDVDVFVKELKRVIEDYSLS